MPGTKATFSLDAATLRKIQSLAERWRVSKTEVLRRAVSQVEHRAELTAQQRIAALHALQKSLKNRGVDFQEWKRTIRDGRR